MPTNSEVKPPERIRVCIRAGKEDWVGVAYAADTTDPSAIHEYVPADSLTRARQEAFDEAIAAVGAIREQLSTDDAIRVYAVLDKLRRK